MTKPLESASMIWSDIRSLFAKLPRWIKWPINTSIGLSIFFFYMPFGILMSHSLYIATLDLSIVLIMTLNKLVTQSINQSISQSTLIVCLGLIGSSALRWFVLNEIKSTTHCRSIRQSNFIAASLLVLPFVQSIMYILLRIQIGSTQSIDPYPFALFIVPFVVSLLVSLSIIWVPTSHELAYQAETDLLRETGLLEHVVRGKAASLRYFLLDHPINQSINQSISQSTDGHVHTQFHDADASKSGSSIHQSINQSKRPVLVCLHGYGAAGLFFAHSMPRWSDVVDVYSVDLLGFGLSSHDPFTASTPSEAEAHFVDSLERWRQSMNIDKMLLLGHSLGGFVAAAYALKYPDHTLAVLLASPVGIPDPPNNHVLIGRSAIIHRFRPLIVWLWQSGLTMASGLHCLGPLGPAVVNWVIHARFGRLSHVSSRPSFARYMYHINAHQGSGLSTLNSLIQPGAYARLPLGERMKHQMIVKTYLIFGENDWMYNAVSVDVVKAMNERGIYANMERVSNSGHQVSFENTREFEQVVMKRIKEVMNTID